MVTNPMSERLTADHCLKVVREAALDIYKEPERVREFFEKPHPMLSMRPPIEVARTHEGAEQVLNLLGRAAYGGGV